MRVCLMAADWKFTPVYSFCLLNLLTWVFLLTYLNTPTAHTNFNLNCIIAMIYILYSIEAFISIECLRYDPMYINRDPMLTVSHCQKNPSPLYISLLSCVLSVAVMGTIIAVLVSHPIKTSQKIGLSIFFICNIIYTLINWRNLFFFLGIERSQPVLSIIDPIIDRRQRVSRILADRRRNMEQRARRAQTTPVSSRPGLTNDLMYEVAAYLGVPRQQAVQLSQRTPPQSKAKDLIGKLRRKFGLRRPLRQHEPTQQEKRFLDVLDVLTDRTPVTRDDV